MSIRATRLAIHLSQTIVDEMMTHGWDDGQHPVEVHALETIAAAAIRDEYGPEAAVEFIALFRDDLRLTWPQRFARIAPNDPSPLQPEGGA